MSRRRFLALGVGCALLPSCAKVSAAPLRIATFPWPGYDPFYLARSLGFLDEAHVRLVELPSSAEAKLAFQNRTVDGLTITLDDVLRLAQTGQEPRITLMLDYSAGADCILAKPEIVNVAALRGRKVGFESGTLGAYIISRALEEEGLSPSDVTIVPLRVDRLDNEFNIGRLDAVVTFDPFRSRLIAMGAREIFSTARIPGEVADALVVRSEVIDSNAAALQELADGWFRALAYIAAQPEEAYRLMAPREGMLPESFAASLSLIHLIAQKENLELLTAGKTPLSHHLARLNQYMLRNHLLASAVDTTALRTDRFVKGTGQ